MEIKTNCTIYVNIFCLCPFLSSFHSQSLLEVNSWTQEEHCKLKLRPQKHMLTAAFQSFYRIESELTAVEQGGDRHQLINIHILIRLCVFRMLDR